MYLVFDIGGTVIKYGLMEETGEIIKKFNFSAQEITSLEMFVAKIKEIYLNYQGKVKGIAFSSPGVIDAKAGIIKIIVAHPYLQGVCLTEEISKACDNLKVTVENDAKCAGLAETWIGNAKDNQDAIVVVLGTGIGGTIIKNKQIHHGKNLFAGEISTIIVAYDKETNKALTWSDIASTTALCKRCAKVLNIESIDGYQIFELLNNNNPLIRQEMEDFCLDIAIQLYNLQYIYDPEVILIGGGISKQPALISMINEAVAKINQETNQLVVPNVTNCKFDNDANLIGALYHFFSQK